MAQAAREWLDRLAERQPSIARAAELGAYEHDLGAAVWTEEAQRVLKDASTLFVCASSDSESLKLGFAASRVLAGATVVVKLTIENAGFATLLEAGEPSEQIRLFSVIDETCSAEMIIDGFTETLARALHNVYLTQGTPSEASVPWEGLRETYREASRAQARHIRFKLQKAGCGVRPLTDWDRPPLELGADEVEELAEIEHERWSQERKDQGWAMGDVRSDEAKRHPLIDVPWEQLPEEDAEHDRAFIRELPRLLAAAGYEGYRTGPPER